MIHYADELRDGESRVEGRIKDPGGIDGVSRLLWTPTRHAPQQMGQRVTGHRFDGIPLPRDVTGWVRRLFAGRSHEASPRGPSRTGPRQPPKRG